MPAAKQKCCRPCDVFTREKVCWVCGELTTDGGTWTEPGRWEYVRRWTVATAPCGTMYVDPDIARLDYPF